MSLIFDKNPRKFSELLNELIDTELTSLKAQSDDFTRLCKCSVISDLFRVKKLMSVMDSRHLSDITDFAGQTFTEYYDMDLSSLEVKLAQLSAKLSRYMKAQVEKNNRADWNKPDEEIWR